MKKFKHFTVVVAAGVLLVGCDKAQPKVAEKVPELKPVTEVAPAAAVAPKAPEMISVTDPKLWSFLPEVVAKVNGKNVTKQQFIAFFATQIPGGKVPATLSSKELEPMMPNLLRGYVDRPLMLAAAEKAGFKPSEKLVVEMLNANLKKLPKEEFAKIKAQVAMTGKTIDELIAEQAKNPDAQEAVATNAFVEKVVTKDIKVSTAEAKKFYTENIKFFTTPADAADSIRASHILVMVRKGDKPEAIAAAKVKAEDILAQVRKNPASFGKLAKESSECPSGKQAEGSLGAFGKGSMVPEFETAAEKLKVNEISGLVQTEFGFHIIRRDALQSQKVQPFAEVEKNIVMMLENQAKEKAMAAFLANLEKENKVEYFYPPMPKAQKPAPAVKAPAKPAAAKK
ncbi:MAG: peptidylprolyl isomerase [Victivallaceae bacterium]|nr:peptidylprolyl isomerase [Victivallaceae bacterium]